MKVNYKLKVKHMKTLGLLLMIIVCVKAQVGGWVENFDDNNLQGWQQDSRTFELQVVDGTLQINYHRVADSWEWDNFNWTPPQKVEATSRPYITLRVKANVSTELTLKPIYDNGTHDWLQALLPDDEQWHTYKFELLAPAPLVLNRIYFYLDGGTTALKSGVVFFDDLRIADSVRTADLLDSGELQRAIAAAQALYANSEEGTDEGQYPSGTRAQLLQAIEQAQTVLNQPEVTQQELDQATWNLFDACSMFEAQVNGPELWLVDQQATLQTRYLYMNLDYLKDKALLFGMQDATGYGVGWSGDDDRSDIKDVCGDYPAFYSEEMYKVTRNIQTERVRYRLTSAYKRGGVLSMCWHQYDPQGRGFYARDVNGENIVATLLPGGMYHKNYKEKLKKVALFFKGLRGPKGEAIPVIFRPYHEHNGDWFWWGKGQCTTQQYIQLWQFTVTYLRDSLNVHNLLYALSPSLDRANWGADYKEIFPGEAFVDVYGVDHYFGDVITSVDRSNFRNGLQRVARLARQDQKIPALTEVGQEGLDTANFFTGVLLWAVKEDSLNNDFSYAAVWRNQDTNHHFAPYPGHPVVPDFLKFYDDPYTFFESDLPDMYAPVSADTLAPYFVTYPLSPFIATDTVFTLCLKTNEKAQLKYDFYDLPFDSMHYSFETGQNRYDHCTTLKGKQGASFVVFVRARDLFGNTMDSSLVITIKVDTLQRPIYWYDLQYDLSQWQQGMAPFVFEGQTDGTTSVPYSRTVYFRKEFELNDVQNISMLAAIVSFDNGFVLFLNGHEVHRQNLGENTINYHSWAVQNLDATQQVILDEQDVQYLKQGKNVLAVEMHQAADDSTDLKFDLKLITATYQTLIDFQQDWFYFSAGQAPEVQILGTEIIASFDAPPKSFYLFPNFPNPFNQTTTIEYWIPATGSVELTVYNVLGQKVKSFRWTQQPTGHHRFQLNLDLLPSGVYWYRVQWNGKAQVRKMLLLK